MSLWAIYARCSTEEQATEGYSIEVQVDACKKILGTIPEAELYNTYLDEGLSGSDPIEKRPAILELLRDAKKKTFNGIIIFKADRLGRLSHEREQVVQNLIRYGMDIKTHSGEILIDNSPQGEFIRKTLANIDELEVKTLSFRIKNTLEYKVRNGEWKGGRPPYGLEWNREEQKMIYKKNLIDHIRLIYKMYVDELKGVYSIVEYLNKNNVPYYIDDKIKIWNKDRVRNILISPIYCGYQWHNTRYGKLDYKPEGKKFKDKNEWELLEAKFVEPIISKEVWDKAQTIRDKRSKKILSIRTNTSWLLTGLLFCKNCGSPMQGHPQINKYSTVNDETREYDCSSYICQGRIENSKLFCNSKQVVKKDIEKVIMERVMNRIYEIVNEDGLENNIKKIVEDYFKIEVNDLNKIEQEISFIQKRIEKYYADYEADKIDADILAPALKRLNKQKEDLLEKYSTIKDKGSKDYEIKSMILKTIQSYKEIGEKLHLFSIDEDIPSQKALLSQIVDKIILDTGSKNIDIYFKVENSCVLEDDSPLATHLKYILNNDREKKID